jgi:endonuclease/exonuclease/phosphatase family metal-dependent hydrolase
MSRNDHSTRRERLRELLIAAVFVGLLPNLVAEDAAAQNAPARQNGHPEPLTVMTWNLEWFFDNEAGDNYSDLAKEKTSPSRREWDWKRDAVAQSIADSKPSILALQEVENRRVLWYLTRALTRNHKLEYHELGIESRDHFTEQDVGFLFRPPVDALTVMQEMYTKRLRSTTQYFDLSKHIRGVFEFQHGDTTETVTVVNIHLRARPEAADKRIRQARLLHHWIASAIGRGQNVIALGDFNTEFRGNQLEKESDIGIACGLETANTDDDLIDLNLRLPASERATHLMGGQYDRILCSRSLIEDDPTRPDLVFSKIEVLRDLAIRGDKDTAEQHWDNFWKIPENERDLSDHYPVMATFEIR